MKMTRSEFEAWPNKAITLLGMSGVGKTTLANRLPKTSWFHYSGDYRIGTKYLEEPILDNIKRQAMKVDFLRDLLRSDSIYICSNITVHNLAPISTFLGKVGNPELGGLSADEFKHRQRLHYLAEEGAMRDVADFIAKGKDIYGYEHFINDAGGSVCELGDSDALQTLVDNTLILYIKADNEAITVRGNNVVELNDVLMGEVWVCSGQSNMEWPMSRSKPGVPGDHPAHPRPRRRRHPVRLQAVPA